VGNLTKRSTWQRTLPWEGALPFLQHSLNNFENCGRWLTGKAQLVTDADRVLGTATKDAKSLIVISSGLSHYWIWNCRKIRPIYFTGNYQHGITMHMIKFSLPCGCWCDRGLSVEYGPEMKNMSGQIMSWATRVLMWLQKRQCCGFMAPYLFENIKVVVPARSRASTTEMTYPCTRLGEFFFFVACVHTFLLLHRQGP